MPKHFNTAGLCQSHLHYMLPSTTKLLELRTLINQRHYFVIHALRQVVKNTVHLCANRTKLCNRKLDQTPQVVSRCASVL